MNKAIRYLFWGYLFIFFRIHIGIDLLADPIGYVLIASGCLQISNHYPQSRKAIAVAIIGAVISIPSIFIDPLTALPQMWEMYVTLLFFLKLLVAYYLLPVLKVIVSDYAIQTLINRTKTVYAFYINIHLLTLFLMTFSMNVPDYPWIYILSTLTIGTFIMDITFLLLLRAIRRATPIQTNTTYNYLI